MNNVRKQVWEGVLDEPYDALGTALYVGQSSGAPRNVFWKVWEPVTAALDTCQRVLRESLR